MKTKFKYFTLMAVALMLGFSSCSNDDSDISGGANNESPKSVFLKIVQDSRVARSVGPSQGTEDVKFSSGTLYLVDGAGAIKDVYTIGAGETADKNIGLAEITDTGSVLENISGSVKKVYVVGNTPSTTLPTSPTTIAQVEKAVLTVESQKDISAVNLFGSGDLVAKGDEEGKYTASLTLNPTVARVELTDIEAKGNYITGFTLDGVFIDNYYAEGFVGGALDAVNLKENGVDPTKFVEGSDLYTAGLKDIVYDWTNIVAADSPLKVVAGESEVWGYNLFAAGGEVPRIILRLSGITTTADEGGNKIYSDVQFITIKGFKNITAFEAGKVYTIGASSLKFDESDLTPNPNMSTIEVEVTVNLAKWTPVPVEPEI